MNFDQEFDSLQDIDIEEFLDDITFLPDSIQSQIAAHIDGIINPAKICNWRPMSKPQRMAMTTEAETLFYGGQAGGGKTSFIVAIPALEHYRSVIFRNTYKNLSEIITQCHEHYIGGSYNGSDHMWRWPDGRTVQLSHLQYEKDKTDHMGIPRDFYGFDEITEFDESTVRFVIGWNRSKIPGQRCRKVFTGNPPMDSKGEWVIPYFAPWLDDTHENPAEDGELRWFIHHDEKDIEVENDTPVKIGKEMIEPLSRTFIGATLQDNPFLRDSGYDQKLLALPEHLKQAMYYGNFNILRQDEDWQLLPSKLVKDAVYPDSVKAELDISKVNALGVDPVRGGNDEFALAPLQGDTFHDIVTYPGIDIPDGKTALAKIESLGLNRNCSLGIDVIGIGGSVYDHAKEVYPNCWAINNANGSTYTDEQTGMLDMVNIRAEAYWRFREDLIKGEIRLPNDKLLLNELYAMKYRLKRSGVLILEKDEIKKIIKRSPDRADAVVMAWFLRYNSVAASVIIH